MEVMDADRLEQLWKAHADGVHAFAARRVGATSAPDVVAEVFIVALRRGAGEPDPTRAWLLGVAHNVIRHDRRARRRLADQLTEEVRS